MLQFVVLDFETASACDLKKSGAWRYAEDLTTEVICCCYETDGYCETWTPEDGALMLMSLAEDPNVTFIAHNAQFEKAIWRNIMVPTFGFPDIPNRRWHCTQAVCAMKALPLALERVVPILGLEQVKDMEGSKAVRALSKPNKKGYYDRTPELLRKAYDYCQQDIRTEVSLHQRLGWLSPGERSVWLLDQRINERGVRLDMAFVSAAQSIVNQASIPLGAEFQEITGGLKFTQRDKVMAWVEGQGVTIPDMKKETLARVLGLDDEVEEDDYETDEHDIDLPDNVRRALSIRQLVGSASVKKLARMQACVCSDGRARGLLQYHAAGPGRWAGRLLQPQNFPRGTLKLGKKAPAPEIVVDAIMTGDPDYVELMLGPAVEVVVSALRHSIIPDWDRLLCAGDFAGIEARIVLALAGQHDKTALMASGADVYLDMAREIYGYPCNKDEHPQERQTGKNSVLGLGFQMGPAKFQSRYAADQPLSFAQRVVGTYRKKWAPKVPPLWYGLEEAAWRAVHERVPYEAFGVLYELEDGWLSARLPSGRKLWYANPQATRKAMPWDQSDVRPSWTSQTWKLGQWKTRDMFGGLLTENVVQALARDLMVVAMFKCERNNLPISLTVHDEIVAEPEISCTNPIALKQIMCDIPDWAKAIQIPVSAETWIGDRYKK